MLVLYLFSKFGSALHIAAHHGHTAVVESLLRREAYINQNGAASETPLFVAAAGGKQDIVRTLLMAGADTKLCNNEGMLIQISHHCLIYLDYHYISLRMPFFSGSELLIRIGNNDNLVTIFHISS